MNDIQEPLIDFFQDNLHTADIRVLKSIFKPGDEVEVRLRRNGSWYRATVIDSNLRVTVMLRSTGEAEIMSSCWEHYCKVWDGRVVTTRFTAREWNARVEHLNDDIRAWEE